jgi:hypothetical protein
MRLRTITISLVIGIAITMASAFLPPLWSPSKVPNTTYMGWPLPWVVQNTAYSWIPIIGPLFNSLLTSFDPIFFGIDLAFWFIILLVVTATMERRADDS